jgi:hypothetical protein
MPKEPQDPCETWWNSCTVLVFYSLESEDAPVGPSRPTLALPFLVDPFRLFGADRSPYLSVQPLAYFLEELEAARKKADEDPAFPRAIQEIEAWLADLKDPVIGYQLEPPALAGSGLATSHIENLIAQEEREAEKEALTQETTSGKAKEKPKSVLLPLWLDLLLFSSGLALIFWILWKYFPWDAEHAPDF